jgi:hypothetical protein
VCAEHSGLSASALEISRASEKIFIVMVVFENVRDVFLLGLDSSQNQSSSCGLLFLVNFRSAVIRSAVRSRTFIYV